MESSQAKVTTAEIRHTRVRWRRSKALVVEADTGSVYHAGSVYHE